MVAKQQPSWHLLSVPESHTRKPRARCKRQAGHGCVEDHVAKLPPLALIRYAAAHAGRESVEAAAAEGFLPAVESFAEREFDHLRLAGGAALSAEWCQIVADVTGKPVRQLADPRHAINRATAFLALTQLGIVGESDLDRFSPLVEMESIDEAYLDMTGSERLLGPPLSAAHALHAAIKTETELNCSIGIGTSSTTSARCSPSGKKRAAASEPYCSAS